MRVKRAVGGVVAVVGVAIMVAPVAIMLASDVQSGSWAKTIVLGSLGGFLLYLGLRLAMPPALLHGVVTEFGSGRWPFAGPIVFGKIYFAKLGRLLAKRWARRWQFWREDERAWVPNGRGFARHKERGEVYVTFPGLSCPQPAQLVDLSDGGAGVGVEMQMAHPVPPKTRVTVRLAMKGDQLDKVGEVRNTRGRRIGIAFLRVGKARPATLDG